MNIEYEEGETIGSATNYERPWRRSVAELPGHFIKVNNTVPFYTVSVFFPSQPHFSYIARSRNNNGTVYVEVPPTGYKAVVTVEPEGAKSEQPLSFGTKQFHSNYTTALKNGYFLEHDFKITGVIPKEPAMPPKRGKTLSVQSSSSPGIFTILSVLLIAALITRSRKKQVK